LTPRDVTLQRVGSGRLFLRPYMGQLLKAITFVSKLRFSKTRYRRKALNVYYLNIQKPISENVNICIKIFFIGRGSLFFSPCGFVVPSTQHSLPLKESLALKASNLGIVE
jgi:hypothetical protein